jgi:LAS superfamily LD-carboxypeptidase LdcB
LEITTGQGDRAIEEVLKTSSVPGTSKHHTGLTVDLSEYKVVLTGFINTRSYQWLSQDNFFNAKRFGYVPSYPVGGTNMGPNPEPWEYIYVGIDMLKK